MLFFFKFKLPNSLNCICHLHLCKAAVDKDSLSDSQVDPRFGGANLAMRPSLVNYAAFALSLYLFTLVDC